MAITHNSIHLYKFVSVNEFGRKTEYSGMFDTEADSREWYEKYGRALSERFNRTLVLTRKGEDIPVSWMPNAENQSLNERHRLPRAN